MKKNRLNQKQSHGKFPLMAGLIMMVAAIALPNNVTAQASYTFSPGAATGQLGPTQAQLVTCLLYTSPSPRD